METPMYSDAVLLHGASTISSGTSESGKTTTIGKELALPVTGTAPGSSSTTSSAREPHHSAVREVDKLGESVAMKFAVERIEKTSLRPPSLNVARCCRQVEAKTVLQTYESIFENDKKGSFLAVTGASGAGKTTLIQGTLQKSVQDHNGFFIAGKFDQLRRPEPYAGFVAAFNDFTNQVVRRGPESVKMIRDAICNAIDNEQARVLISMIPSLTRILGVAQKSSEEQSSLNRIDETGQRFLFVFRLFLQCVSSLEQPIVLLIDDWHFADVGSRELLASTVADLKHCQGLCIVATYENETTDRNSDDVLKEDWALSKLLRTAVKSDTIAHVTLSNLSELQVVDLLSSSLGLSRGDRCAALGQLVSRKTKGNVLYIDLFVEWLHEKNLISNKTGMGSWNWDLKGIHTVVGRSPIACCFDSLLKQKFTNLSQSLADVLKVAACLGSNPDEIYIEIALQRPVRNDLFEATRRGFLIRPSSDESSPYCFKHDCIQALAYNLIPESQRALFHIEIGRRLWCHLESVDRNINIFAVMSQVYFGKHHILEKEEKHAAVCLCLHAGQKAALSSAFSTALVYLDLAIELLDKSAWEKHYDLTLAVYNAACEMEMCTANFENMEERVQVILRSARNVIDKRQAYSSQIYSLGVSNHQGDSIAIAIDVLKGLHETFPRHLRQVYVLKEMLALRRLVKGKSNEQLLRLPGITNSEKLAALQILNQMYIPSIAIDPVLAALVSLKRMRLTLQYGTCLISPLAFASYGILCVSITRDVDEGFRFGELALQMLERNGAKQFLPRVYAAFYGCIYPWKKPVRNTLDHLLFACRMGMESGDTEFGCVNATIYCFYAFESGLSLDKIESMWSEFQETMTACRQKALINIVLPKMQLIHHFMGYSTDPLASKGDLIDSEEYFKECVNNNHIVYHTQEMNGNQMILAYILNEFEIAERYSHMGMKGFRQPPPTCDVVFSSFIGALSALGVASQGKNVRQHVRFAKGILKSVARVARVNPENFSDKMYLLEAEIARIAGRNDLAAEKYAISVALARENGFLLIEAIASERAARFHLESSSRRSDAEAYFRRSCSLYCKWGGKVKYDRLRAEIDEMYGHLEAKPVAEGH